MGKSRDTWRRILESQDYEVNKRGDVRQANTKKLVVRESSLTGEKVKLWFDGDARTFRVNDLVKKYFPETLEWRKIDAFPDYEISHIGSIRNASTLFELPILQMKGFPAKAALWHEGTRHLCLVSELMEQVFGTVEVE